MSAIVMPIEMAASVKVPGAFGEIGVFRGSTFFKIAAHANGRELHAFDSFRGMADPGPKDGDEYPGGKFDVGGPEQFKSDLLTRGIEATIWEGYIPDCFDGCEARFALLHIDVDHYQATLIAARWAWQHLAPGGVLVFDDYYGDQDTLATGAINEFIEESGARIVKTDHRSICIAPDEANA